ncbi:MAG TPA: CAAD domain-containing protein [Stenomitos sp.]
MNTETDAMNQTVGEVPVDTKTTDPLDMSLETPGTLLKIQSPDRPLGSPELREQLDKALRFLVLFPDYLNGTLGEYRKPLSTVGLILLAGLGLAVADGVLDRLNSIPLFAPTFELVGLGFTGWVVVRYMLYADTRQELLQAFEEVKDRVVGKEAG